MLRVNYLGLGAKVKILKLIKDGDIQFSYTQEELANKTMFLFSMQGILLVYFLNNINTVISNEHIKSFFSKAFDWEKFNVNFSVSMNSEQQEIMREIRTGIKHTDLKKDQSIVNYTYSRSNNYSVIEDMSNNIIVQYISGKNGKHTIHKLPVLHWREGHWRHYKNGTKVWVEGKWVGGNEDNLYAA